ASTTLDSYASRNETMLFITVLRNDLPLQPTSTTGNGYAAGGAIDRLKATATATGDLRLVTRNLTALNDTGLALALDAVAGEIHAAATHLPALDGESVVDVVRSEITNRLTSRDAAETSSRDMAVSLWGSNRQVWARVRRE